MTQVRNIFYIIHYIYIFYAVILYKCILCVCEYEYKTKLKQQLHGAILIFTSWLFSKLILFLVLSCVGRGFPGGSVVKNLPTNAEDASLIPGSGRAPGEGNGNPLQCFLLGKSHGQRSLEEYSPYSCKRVGHDIGLKQQQQSCVGIFMNLHNVIELHLWIYMHRASQVTLVLKNPPANAEDVRDTVPSWGQEDPQEKGMETHTSILAWRIPWAAAWWTTVHRVAKSQTRLKRHICTHIYHTQICMFC